MAPGHSGPSCVSGQHLLLSVVADPRRPKDSDVHADPVASLLTSSEDPAMQPSELRSQRHLRDVPGPTCHCGASCEAPTSAQGSGQKTTAVARESPGASQPWHPASGLRPSSPLLKVGARMGVQVSLGKVGVLGAEVRRGLPASCVRIRFLPHLQDPSALHLGRSCTQPDALREQGHPSPI